MKYRRAIPKSRGVTIHKVLSKSASIRDKAAFMVFVIGSQRIRKEYSMTKEIWKLSRNYHANILLIPPNRMPIPVYY